ncbi:MAG: asparagine synthase-related protein [Desulfobacterales bacterium]
MSGFAGVLRTDGAPIDPAVFDRFLPILRRRGPDGDGNWSDQGIGFGYSNLNIEDRRPCSGPFLRSDELAIVGDVRLDARDELIGALDPSGLENPTHQPDLNLILQAYRQWGKRCLEHLKGDFSFALWDQKERRLFCARDHFGVRPFYYGAMGDTLVFSNTLACLLVFEEIAASLDESVIGEYLLFGHIRRLARTPFSKIRRLPPAHSLSHSNSKRIDVQRYWTLIPNKIDSGLKEDDILHQFRHLMRLAVSDRLPGSGALVMMSGGLDSTCVAAFAVELFQKPKCSRTIQACTFGWQQWLPDREAEFAQKAADALQILLHPIDCAEDTLEWSANGCGGFCPEPTPDPPASKSYRHYLGLLERFRVALTGQGGDPALDSRTRHAGSFFKSLLLNGLGKEMLRYRHRTGAFPPIGLRSSIRSWLGRKELPQTRMPPWIAADFSRRCSLKALFRELNRPRQSMPCLRSEAHRFISGPLWPMLFEQCDAASMGVAAQVRHPFFDLRLMTFLLSLSPVPWCVDKHILRKTLAGRLPEEIVRRPKTPLPGYPLYEMIRVSKRPLPVINLLKESGLDRFVDRRRYLQILQNSDKIRPGEYELITRPLGLAWWLTQRKPWRFDNPATGGNHGSRSLGSPQESLP